MSSFSIFSQENAETSSRAETGASRSVSPQRNARRPTISSPRYSLRSVSVLRLPRRLESLPAPPVRSGQWQ